MIKGEKVQWRCSTGSTPQAAFWSIPRFRKHPDEMRDQHQSRALPAQARCCINQYGAQHAKVSPSLWPMWIDRGSSRCGRRKRPTLEQPPSRSDATNRLSNRAALLVAGGPAPLQGTYQWLSLSLVSARCAAIANRFAEMVGSERQRGQHGTPVDCLALEATMASAWLQ